MRLIASTTSNIGSGCTLSQIKFSVCSHWEAPCPTPWDSHSSLLPEGSSSTLHPIRLKTRMNCCSLFYCVFFCTCSFPFTLEEKRISWMKLYGFHTLQNWGNENGFIAKNLILTNFQIEKFSSPVKVLWFLIAVYGLILECKWRTQKAIDYIGYASLV